VRSFVVLLAAALSLPAGAAAAARATSAGQRLGLGLPSVVLRVVGGHGQSVDGSAPQNCTLAPAAGATYVCGSLSVALEFAPTLHGAATTVLFGGTYHVGGDWQPLQLRSAAAPATLRLQGPMAIDGGGTAGLLHITGGGGAVSVDSVVFLRGWVSYARGTKMYAPVTVGFPKAMGQPTTFSNCSFMGNVGAYGGAAALHHGTTVFEGCSFIGSRSYGNGGSDVPHQHGGGGALYNIGGLLILRRSRFLNSSCSDPPGATPGSTGGHNGGAVLSMRGRVVVDDCEFTGGVAGQGGALYLFLYASLTARRTSFLGNRAVCVKPNATAAGAGDSDDRPGQVPLHYHDGCTWASGTGGAIFVDRGAAAIVDGAFEDNVADLAGGALYAWNSNKRNNVTIVGGSFLRNQARRQWGGALANWHSTVAMTNGTVLSGNHAMMMGGALWTDAESTSLLDGVTTFVNNTVTSNGTGTGGGVAWSHPKGTTHLVDHNAFVVDNAEQATRAVCDTRYLSPYEIPSYPNPPPPPPGTTGGGPEVHAVHDRQWRAGCAHRGTASPMNRH
jgi:hypothetical protein